MTSSKRPRTARKPVPAAADTPAASYGAALHLAAGDPVRARDALLPVLDGRAAAGDAESAVAAALLRHFAPPPSPGIPPPPDPLSGQADRLVRVVRQQDAQIRTLHAMIEDLL